MPFPFFLLHCFFPFVSSFPVFSSFISISSLSIPLFSFAFHLYLVNSCLFSYIFFHYLFLLSAFSPFLTSFCLFSLVCFFSASFLCLLPSLIYLPLSSSFPSPLHFLLSPSLHSSPSMPFLSFSYSSFLPFFSLPFIFPLRTLFCFLPPFISPPPPLTVLASLSFLPFHSLHNSLLLYIPPFLPPYCFAFSFSLLSLLFSFPFSSVAM